MTANPANRSPVEVALQRRLQEEARRDAELSVKVSRLQIRGLTDEEKTSWFRVFDQWGISYFYEAIANNIQLAALARHHHVPFTVMDEWWREHMDPAKVRHARQLAAAMAAVEGTMVLEDPMASASPSQAAHARSQAEHMRWLAERQDNDLWGPPMPSVPDPGRVSIVLSLDGRNVPQEVAQRIDEKRQAKLDAAPKQFDPRTAQERELDAEDVTYHEDY